MSFEKKQAKANLENLYRIFTIAEAPDSTLAKIDQAISENLFGFLQEHIVAVEQELEEIEKDFSDPYIPEEPIFVSEQTEFLLKKVVAQSVHTSSPSFVGHMTSALPYFMLPLSKIMMALNQNLVKIETSKAFTPLERQVIGMLHSLVYAREPQFYKASLHNAATSLGAVCSGGTIANITALWAARNHLLGPKEGFAGVHRVGMHRALEHFGYKGLAVLVSKRGHYSLSKAADVLGIGRDGLIPIATDDLGKVCVEKMATQCKALAQQGVKVLAIVGVAGASETGVVDPLDELAALAQEQKCFFHVDAAWGGPTLFSRKYRGLLSGIEKADSVVIDAHKQLYVPMGVGTVLFKDPRTVSSIEHHAQYIIREGSKDLGSHTLEGSRPGMAMLIHSGLKVIGKKGYEMLIDQSIERARQFAEMIRRDDAFELVTAPELNILTYRYVPDLARSLFESGEPVIVAKANEILNRITRYIQKTQREHGRAFVSRTRLSTPKYGDKPVTVFRVVLANPLTTTEILGEILEEQAGIAKDTALQSDYAQLHMLASAYGKQSGLQEA